MSQTPPSALPTGLVSLERWAAAQGIPSVEARRRFAQLAVYRSIAASEVLRAKLVFKGGNALFFVYSSRRSTADLDFSAEALSREFPLEKVREELDRVLPLTAKELGIRLKVQRAERDPPDLLAKTPTYSFTIAYAFPGERTFSRWEVLTKPVATVAKLEIALNEVVCESRTPSESGIMRGLRVSTLEDIAAEKLRALLQQVPRNRSRPQDVYDLAALLARGIPLDLVKVSAYLKRKAAARGITPSRAAFDDQRVWRRAEQDYSALRNTVSGEFISFGLAKAAVLGLVSRLELPADGPPLLEKEPAR